MLIFRGVHCRCYVNFQYFAPTAWPIGVSDPSLPWRLEPRTLNAFRRNQIRPVKNKYHQSPGLRVQGEKWRHGASCTVYTYIICFICYLYFLYVHICVKCIYLKSYIFWFHTHTTPEPKWQVIHFYPGMLWIYVLEPSSVGFFLKRWLFQGVFQHVCKDVFCFCVFPSFELISFVWCILHSYIQLHIFAIYIYTHFPYSFSSSYNWKTCCSCWYPMLL